MVGSFLATHWKKIAIAVLFSALVGALWAYRAEVQEHAQALVEVSYLQNQLEESQEEKDRLKEERERALESVSSLERDLREIEEIYREHREVLEDEASSDWRSRELPESTVDRLRNIDGGAGADGNGD